MIKEKGKFRLPFFVSKWRYIMMKLKVDIREFNKKNKKLDRDFKKSWRKVFIENGKLIVQRASLVHKYTRRTNPNGLTDSNQYRVTTNGDRLSISNNVMNKKGTKYAKYVDRWEKSKGGRGWLTNAINYYKRRMKVDFENITKTF